MVRINLANFGTRVSLIWMLCFIQVTLSAQGLQFTGGHQPIEERSSLELFYFNTESFDNDFNISFDLEQPSRSPVGYILRIKSKEQSKIFNLHYDEENGNAVFRFNEEGKRSLVTAKIGQEMLHEKHWLPLSIKFDLCNDRIVLTVNNMQVITDRVTLPDRYTPLIFFGKSDYLIDVPPMAIRNLRIGNDKHSIAFPLREHAGKLVHDENGKIYGRVTNPKWLINDSYHWKHLRTYLSSTEAGADYSERRNEVYYFNRDSITIFNLRSGESKSTRFIGPCPVKLILGNSFINDLNSRLYVYETYYRTPYNGPTFASLDLNSFTWRTESYQQVNLELNHHSYFFDPQRNNFTIFGGYGNMAYSNDFRSYSFKNSKWRLESSYQGKALIPRYFSSAGLSPDNTQAFLFGGMGNEAGKHIVGRKYFYDLHVLNLNKSQIEKLWEVEWKGPNIVPARGVVVPDSNFMYIMGYPEHLTNSNIRLYRFNLKNGNHEILGDSIPIYSDRISTRAKLFYDRKLNQLLTLVQESTDDISSKLSVYVLNFPPISTAELSYMPRKDPYKVIYAFIGVVIVTIGLGVWVYLRRTIRLSTEPDATTLSTLKNSTHSGVKKNSIFLFGDFTVLDRNGRNITHLFSSRLKQTFCLLLSHMETGGISSKSLSHTLWPDKSQEKVKTLRGVTLNNLRKVLSELDGVKVIFDKGNFCLVFSDTYYCDYNECVKLIEEGLTIDNQRFLDIISRGQFLFGEEHVLFDSIKNNMESKLSPILLRELKNYHKKKQHLKTIQIADLLFKLDSINEEALVFSIKAMMAIKQEEKAKGTYRLFLTNYQRMMGEDFAYSFDELRKKHYE